MRVVEPKDDERGICGERLDLCRKSPGCGDEDELIRRAMDDGDQHALECIFRIYEGLLRKLARSYESSLLPAADAYQVAAIGLMKALRRYDRERGTAFKSYAYPNIEGELKKFYRDSAEMIRLPRRVWKLRGRIREVEERCLEEDGIRPTAGQIAEILGVGEDEVLEARGADNYLAPLSIDRPMCRGDSDGSFKLMSLLGSEDSNVEKLEDSIAMEDAMGRLPWSLRRVVELRMKGGQTQAQVARQMNISQMQVSRLQRKACDIMRHYVAPEAPRGVSSN